MTNYINNYKTEDFNNITGNEFTYTINNNNSNSNNNDNDDNDDNDDFAIDKYLHKMKKFRKYNPQSYDSGYNYMKMFIYIIHDLEKDDISHPKQYFENAQLYLKKSLNLFQSIGLSVPEENMIHALKYNKFESNKLSNRIGKLCKKIYKHCFYILYNLSLRFNEDFFEKPDIYKCEIELNTGLVEESNTFNESYELF